jgi:hypothetical protein
MHPSRERQTITLALRCYPARWRLRHGEEARLLSFQLLDDGVSWWSLVASFLGGALLARAIQRPSIRLGATMAVLAIGATTVPLALLTSLTPASASSTNVVIVISKPADAAPQLESAFSSHHFKLTVTERAVPTRLVGSILSVTIYGESSASDRVISELRGKCSDGALGCINGLVLPRHFSGRAHVTIGRASRERTFAVSTAS